MSDQEQARLDSLESDMRRIVSTEFPPQRPTVETVEERGPVTLGQWMASLVVHLEALEKQLLGIEKFLGIK
jgi:hypothetical protein